MTVSSSVKKILQIVMPMNSHRRLIGRTVKQVVADPGSLSKRINATNVGNFLRFRSRRFECSVCGANTTPLYDFPDLNLRHEHMIGETRETLQCRKCYASMRQRTLALALLDVMADRTGFRHGSIAALARAGLSGVRILDTDNFSAISRHLRGQPGYTRCSYLPDRVWGSEVEPGYYNINLERIDFDDATFDLVLTSDVMEHVRDSDAAHAEIARILRRGGAYVFTIPYDETRSDDIVLVDTTGPEDVFLCPPHYHGDPLSGGILAYRIFGKSLIAKLTALGFDVQFRQLEDVGHLVMDGDVFTAVKQ